MMRCVGGLERAGPRPARTTTTTYIVGAGIVRAKGSAEGGRDGVGPDPRGVPDDEVEAAGVRDVGEVPGEAEREGTPGDQGPAACREGASGLAERAEVGAGGCRRVRVLAEQVA
jgi:hypothetical protein